jgi:hypothetical protein
MNHAITKAGEFDDHPSAKITITMHVTEAVACHRALLRIAKIMDNEYYARRGDTTKPSKYLLPLADALVEAVGYARPDICEELFGVKPKSRDYTLSRLFLGLGGPNGSK